MTVYNDAAHANAANLSQLLVNQNLISQDQANQMCDGRVSDQNLRQAEGAVAQAAANGDGYGFGLARNLAQSLRVALNIQRNAEQAGGAPYRETDRETVRDANRDAQANFGAGFNQVPRETSGQAVLAGAVQAGLEVGLAALLTRGNNRGRNCFGDGWAYRPRQQARGPTFVNQTNITIQQAANRRLHNR